MNTNIADSSICILQYICCLKPNCGSRYYNSQNDHLIGQISIKSFASDLSTKIG